MGISDLRDLNLCLLISWVQRYHEAGPKIWRAIIDSKYHNYYPNIFYCRDRKSSPSWKGVLWAIKAVKMGFRWSIGNGEKDRFWENQWFGHCSLAI
jgi:hypothetical protein